MAARSYIRRRRKSSAGRTSRAILDAARDLVRTGSPPGPTVGAIAARAGVSRLSVYHHFGSRTGVLAAVADGARTSARLDATDLRSFVAAAATHWATDPPLFRRLPDQPERHERLRELAASLAAADDLRPGCSLKEAEDVIGVLTSFAAFDRLHQDGRRSTAAVTEMLMRMAGSILNPSS